MGRTFLLGGEYDYILAIVMNPGLGDKLVSAGKADSIRITATIGNDVFEQYLVLTVSARTLQRYEDW